MMDARAFSSHSDASVAAATTDQNVEQCRSGNNSEATIMEKPRRWHDVFWSGMFVIHLIGFGFVLVVLGLNRFKKKNRLDIDKYTYRFMENQAGLTEDYWPVYAVAGLVGTALGCCWLSLLGSCATLMMKVSVHILTTYLAVISVLSFWAEQVFWGVAFAIGACLQLLYVISVIDRLPFTMLVLQKAVKMVWNLPEVMKVAHAFVLLLLSWMVLWSFGVAGVVASSMGDGGRWWLLVVLSVSLFWTGAVLCNTLHVVVSGIVFLANVHYSKESSSFPTKSLMKSLQYALTTSFGSICYGSLFTAVIRTMRWQIGVYGKSFNHSARDAWELFQSTGVEALVAYDCSGAIMLMGTIFGGLITGTCAGAWAWIKWSNRAFMIGSMSMLMGMMLVGVAMVVVESAVTSIYVCYAEDPLSIHRWDPEFFNQISETLNQRLQHRSKRVSEVLTHNQLDNLVRSNTSV
ncbi:CTL-like protein DDB_G0274487 isoform X2 [Arachis ipaensis]|uniref:CTL-like protein DDB_G0274487 isoform X2 n=1 Tax=Arachis ipaensis TaxID=130454 RepID=UPI000A2B5B58|nr:CTL-like protein DDB_G0274487 isoform X2 [Arachis ipaensis]XP_025655122.1 CTL-like protein DDB_G0274487 isoform X2 [Arachis hypogaea]